MDATTIGQTQVSAKNTKAKKKRRSNFSKHRYFREAWALTFVGGADFEDRRPATRGKHPEYFGVSRIAVSREVRVLVSFIRSRGGLQSFLAEQATSAVTLGKVPAGCTPEAFVRYRLDLLLYIAHATRAHKAKAQLKSLVPHIGRYRLPLLPSSLTNVLPLRSVSVPRPAPSFETVDAFLARGGVISVYSSPEVVQSSDGKPTQVVRLIREIRARVKAA